MVAAQTFETRPKLINLVPDPVIAATQTINLADSSNAPTVQLEKDVLLTSFLEPGRYFGPYMRSSLFQFTYDVGGRLTFSSSFIFPRNQIANGVGAWWVRFPVDVTRFSSYAYSVNPLIDPAYTRGAKAPAEEGDNVISDASGLYVKMFNWLLPNRTYSFIFTGELLPDTSAAIWVSIEKYQVSNVTSFVFRNNAIGSLHTENLTLYPAFAFNFLSGLGESGLTSYRVPFDGTNSSYIFRCMDPDASTATLTDHVSIYVPFAGAPSVSWLINMTVVDTESVTATEEWTVSGTHDFLLTSSPSSLTALGITTPITNPPNVVCVYLRPSVPIVLLGVVPDDPQDEAVFYYSYLSLGSSRPFGQFGGPSIARLSLSNFFISIDFTSGAWAVVTPGALFVTYDFGWGRAFLFPGQVNLVMFLTNGTTASYNSASSLFSGPGPSLGPDCRAPVNSVVAPGSKDILTPVAGWVNGLACFLLGLPGDVSGVIQSVFQAIWSALSKLGEWIVASLAAFIDSIVSLVAAIAAATLTLVQALVAAIPFILILFVAARGLPDVMEIRAKAQGAVLAIRSARAIRRQRRAQRVARREQRRQGRGQA